MGRDAGGRSLSEAEYIKGSYIKNKDLSTGNIDIELDMDDMHYYSVLSDLTGTPIENEYHLIHSLKDYAALKKAFDAAAPEIVLQ